MRGHGDSPVPGQPMRQNPTCCYDSLELPRVPGDCADAQIVLNAAKALRHQLERVPYGPNRREAMVRLDKAVMVALGGFNVRARERGDKDGTSADGSALQLGGSLDTE